ncbi:ubiquitin conjugating enzyme [Diplodia corticola]|uniref:Ubiquitin conjugating enzyme n=1 Tax=Diplodia corticola TaxID=236234 RepID=A0A1J9RUY6_9PEZI|nr:ubiquitin conjugating enzyme [Diplodia corticola]OJD31309.1 ubiquitin conjugating enzyme [Diplodia corticola]
MGRKEFRAHLEQVTAAPDRYGVLDVCCKDSEIEVLVQSQHGPLTVTAVVDEICDYPHSHNFISLYVQDSAPNDVSSAISILSEKQTGPKSIFSLLKDISQRLSADTDGDTDMFDSQLDGFDEDEGLGDESESSDASDDDFFGVGHRPAPVVESSATATHDKIIPPELRNSIRRDLALVKHAGFRVSAWGPLVQGHPAYLTSACRVAKLGISHEAMQAWQLCPSEYLVLLIHYPTGYKHIGDVDGKSASKDMLDFRFGVSSSYKPSPDEVIQAFTTLPTEAHKGASKPKKGGLRKLFIAGPLGDLFRQKFLPLLRCRIKEGMSWDGAMAFWHDHHTTGEKEKLAQDPKYYTEEKPNATYASIVTADHITSHQALHVSGDRLSLPLVAMQFFVRQVVRCTEFCLVCHRRMPPDIEAIKPYVCDSQLCLYQYLQLGFGPSIEHEIISQPKVVDLLISLCWASARTGRLKQKHLPRGLGLRIPPVATLKLAARTNPSSSVYPKTIEDSTALARLETALRIEGKEPWRLPSEMAHAARVNLETCQLLFEKEVTRKDLNLIPGDWIQFKVKDVVEPLHCKIEQMMLPTIQLSKPVLLDCMRGSDYVLPGLSRPGFQDVSFVAYDQDLDSFHAVNTQEVMVVLLDLLPTVEAMKDYLLMGGAQADLAKWTRIPAASLGLLRWIIASNRACIMQVSDDAHDQVWGMPQWTQFRIAMGAPDKERRFINSVKTVGSATNPDVPTIFAWHGSALYNWHSIIREGLNFEQTMHGRAYGHGVYLSKDLGTSLGYSRAVSNYQNPNDATWSSSKLLIYDAVSLNEIVNSPSKFVSSIPHFVVNQIDWIQTRYLFVQTSASRVPHADQTPVTPQEQPLPLDCIRQDQVHFPVNTARKKIEIPASSTRSRAKGAKISSIKRAISKGFKKLRTGGAIEDPIDLDDDAQSVATDQDDRELLQMEVEQTNSVTLQKRVVPANRDPQAAFVPGQLDFSTLEILPSPEGSAASIMASKRLHADFGAMVKSQSSQPLDELGWYIDPEHMENLYQWIVELHSFEAHLPLAQDMRKKNVESVVLELTFGKDYPFTPPFVRVIRPRFLPFMMGGGGHVTAGGALCMELLTNDGWAAVNSIESVLMQVRLAISSLEPRPARLDRHAWNTDYKVGEAIDAYIRACHTHGWTVPPGFKEMVWAGRKGGRNFSGYE